MKWIALIAACVIEVKTAECNLGCRYLGYNMGTFKDPKCLCYDVKEFESVVEKDRLALPVRMKKQNDD